MHRTDNTPDIFIFSPAQYDSRKQQYFVASICNTYKSERPDTPISKYDLNLSVATSKVNTYSYFRVDF